MSGQPVKATFKLSPQESFVHGVQLGDDALVFRAAGTQVILACLWFALGVPVGAMTVVASLAGSLSLDGLEVANPAAGVAAGALMAVSAVATGVGLLRRGVVADQDGLRLRWVVRQRRLPWAEVAAVVVAETPSRRWSTRAGASGVGARVEPVGSWSVGLVVMFDGTALQLPSFTSAARGEGLSMGGPTAAELKVAALRRYREHVDGAWPEGGRDVEKVVDPARTQVLAAGIAWPLALWLFLSWATGDWVPLMWLVLGYAISGIVLLGRRRRDRLANIRT